MSTPPDPATRATLVKNAAREVGFDLVGIASLSPSPRAEFFRDWLAAGKHGSMDYLQRTVNERVDLAEKLPWAKSVVCVALSYFDPVPEPLRRQAGPDDALVARYAVGRDYHAVFDGRLRALERQLRQHITEPFTCRTWSDAQPIMEREYAARAGLGWVGKHTLIIHPRHGSWFLLGELVTSLELAPDSTIADHCGTCTRCIQACPTGAITPYSVDARRCISYQTLEHRGEVPGEFHGPMRDARFVVGCDICQEVCPFNRAPLPVSNADLKGRGFAATGVVSLPVIQQWDAHAWDVATRGKAYRRAKPDMWQRTADVLVSGKAAVRDPENEQKEITP